MAQIDYIDKDIAYFSKPRLDLVSLLPKNPNQKILEIGAGGGDTLVEIKKRGLAQEVVGVELMKLVNSNQQNVLIDKMIIANLDNEKPDLPNEYFDIILAGDVLEHLVDPWGVVETISGYLKKGGLLIVSLPNIQEIQTLYKVFILGDFAYNPEGGILDKTHIRFFTKKNIKNLFTTKDLKVQQLIHGFEIQLGGKSKRALANKLTLGLLSDFWAVQYLVIAQKI